MLLRVTGGAFAAGRLPENYYGQFIRAAEKGGIAAVCAMDQFKDRMDANPRNRDYLQQLSTEQFLTCSDAGRRSSTPGRTCQSWA